MHAACTEVGPDSSCQLFWPKALGTMAPVEWILSSQKPVFKLNKIFCHSFYLKNLWWYENQENVVLLLKALFWFIKKLFIYYYYF